MGVTDSRKRISDRKQPALAIRLPGRMTAGLSLLLFSLIILSACSRNAATSGKNTTRSMLIEGYVDPSTCELRRTILDRDICYWDAAIIERYSFYSDTDNMSCQRISNPLLQLVCLRMQIRPHMVTFATRGTTDVPVDTATAILPSVQECRGMQGAARLFCTFLRAAKVSRENISAGEETCRALHDEMVEGECMFFVARERIINLSDDVQAGIRFMNLFCPAIVATPWRAECHYLIADELALLRPSPWIEGVVQACQHSIEAYDYRCFNHAAMFLPENARVAFCSLLNESHSHKPKCFEAVGYRGGCDGRTLEDTCGEVSSRWRPVCENAWASMIGECGDGSTSERMLRCRSLPGNLSSPCLLELSLSAGQVESLEPVKALQACAQFPEPFADSCRTSLAEATGRSSWANLTATAKRCLALPPDLQDGCFGGMITSIRMLDALNTNLAIQHCSALPESTRNKCVSELQGKEPIWALRP